MSNFNIYSDRILGDVKNNLSGYGYAYIKILVLWMLLESWVDYYYSFDENTKPGKAVNELRLDTNNPLFNTYRGMTSQMGGVLQGLRNLGFKIQPARTASNDRVGGYDPSEKPEDVVAVLYKIRNKVAHGEWKPSWLNENASQNNIVFMAANELERWLRMFKAQDGFSKQL